MLESKIFANGSTTLPKSVREALDAAEDVMDENRTLLRKLK